jgi:hypothetical protein
MNFVRRRDYMFLYEKSMCFVERLRRKVWICYFDFLKSVFHFLFFKKLDLSITSLQFVVRRINLSTEDIIRSVAYCSINWVYVREYRDSEQTTELTNWRLYQRLKYVSLNSTKLLLMIFTNSSLTNNQDLWSQIDYVICLTNSKHVNVVHWSLIKCKRVIESVLTAEWYALVHDFDLDAVLKATLYTILDCFVFLLFCIDSKSLYKCLIKLDTTQKKRFMINVMSFR